MIRRMKQFDVISRYRQGESYRHIARELGIYRKTVKAICDRYKKGINALNSSKSEQEVEEATEQLVLTRSYDKFQAKSTGVYSCSRSTDERIISTRIEKE
ncbi:helix-turn-helix domain-containing protein [Aerococcus sp. NPDC058936]|uniref:helix-turn-helix domain-containing protein n=1 Tax=Aerococcus sp. NPDC058936 TaxID=3346674 RepID=UPI00366EE244